MIVIIIIFRKPLWFNPWSNSYLGADILHKENFMEVKSKVVKWLKFMTSSDNSWMTRLVRKGHFICFGTIEKKAGKVNHDIILPE